MARTGVGSLVFLFSLVGCLAGIASGAPADYEGKPIVSIDFVPEEQPYSRQYLLDILPVKLNTPLQLSNVRAAIQRLFATGRYADIYVDAELRDGGVALRFITQKTFFVGRVTTQGVPEPPNNGVLVNATRLELGAHYTDRQLREAVQNLTQVLQNNGFFESHVVPEFDYNPDTQQVQIRFIIEPGIRARFAAPVITGKPERSPEEIADATHWRGWFGWKKVTEARTQDGLHRVRESYRKEGRMMAQVLLKGMDFESDTERVTPTLNIQAGPKVRIETVGAKVSEKKLREMVPVYQEQSVDRGLLLEGANNLKNYFERQGYFHVKVDFENRPSGPDQELIVYKIDRGDRHRVAAVLIQGNTYFSDETIRERMFVRPAGRLELRRGRYSDLLLRTDLDTIRALYQSNGFRDVEVTSRIEHGYGGRGNDMAVFIQIAEGPQWLVDSLDLSGVSKENEEHVRSLVTETPGQPYSELNVAVDRDNILDYYYNHGYPDASFEWSFQPAKEPHRVNLKYAIREGPRKFVRDVLVSGLDATDPSVVDERIMLQPGEPLSRAAMLDTQRRLYNLGIFAKVDMALQNPDGEETSKFVLLNMEEASKYTITGGLGAEIAKIGGCQSCLDAPAGTAGFSPRVFFGLTRRNMFGNGHIASLSSRVSTLQKRGVLTYQAPQFRGSPNVNLLFSTLFDQSHDVRTFNGKTLEGSAQVGHRLSRANQFLYRFTYRRVNVSDLQIQPLLIPLLSQPDRVGILGGSFIQDRRDDPTDAHRGIYSTIDFGWATHFFGSAASGNFTRLLARNATYHPFGMGGRIVFARELTFGWIKNLNGLQTTVSDGTTQTSQIEIPLPERFFAGGANSLRGFAENQAGPRDLITGFPLGGNGLLASRLELRFPLIGENITGVLFEDAGNVYTGVDTISFRVDQHGVTDFDYMVHAVGFGLRYRTPVGPIRVDLAYAINPPQFVGFKGTREQLLFGGGVRTLQQLSHFQFHFSIGQAF